VHDSKIGPLYVASTKKGVCRILLPNESKRVLQKWASRHLPDYELQESASFNKQIIDELQRYFDRKLVRFRSKTHLLGTDFQIKVWKKLTEVSYGQTNSYKNIAKKVGLKNGGFQAVGGAVGSNPLPIIIPCHRILGSDKSLTGYGGGIKTKEFLLRLEGALPV
jgi:O-6-methylguanine DNA methyltransferase